MSRRAAKIDSNHSEVVRALERCGYLVLSLARLGGGAPDALAYCPAQDRFRLIEIKSGKGKLREGQIAFQRAGWPVQVIRNLADVEAMVRDR